MDRIEAYVERVCGRIGGAREMRAHVRRELREHLMDAVAERRAAGMGEGEAIEKALEDFGGPEEVREELEAAHGHRMTAVVIEKAMDWKEKTMKAKWLWMTLAHVAVSCVVMLEVLYVFGAMIFVVPKYREMVQNGWIATSGPGTEFNAWAVNYMVGVADFCENWWVIALPVAAAWGLFEWRVRSENKGWIRLSLMGIAAVALLVVSVLTSVALVLPPLIEMPVLANRSADVVRASMERFDREVPLVEEAAAKKDWEGVVAHGAAVQQSARQLATFWATGPIMMGTTDDGRISTGQKALRRVQHRMYYLIVAAAAHDEKKVEEEMKEFRAAAADVRGGESATKP